MALVIHEIGNNRYAYNHHKVGKKVKSDYIGPVDKSDKIRNSRRGEGVDRVNVGTTTASLREIYNKAVRRKAMEDAEAKKKK